MRIRSGSVRRLASAAPMAFALLATIAASGQAQVVRDTVATFVARSSAPLMAADPVDGTVHVGYFDGVAFRHAWSGGGPWQDEVAVPAFSYPGYLFELAWAAGAGGKLALVNDTGAGVLQCVVRDGGVWTPSVVVTHTGWSYFPAAAIGPVDGEPVVAFVGYDYGGADPGLYHIGLAHHGPSGWEVAEADTTRVPVGPPGLALDGAGAPRLALARFDGPGGSHGGEFLLEAPSISGPYTWTLVDTLINAVAGASGLALDRWSDEPRIAYQVAWSNMELRYTARSAGVWTGVQVSHGNANYNPGPVSIALTPAGDPRIVVTEYHNILAGSPEQTQFCGGGVASPDVEYFKRTGASGTGAFTVQQVAHWARSGPAAVIAGIADGAQLMWRDPPSASTTCTTYMIHAVDQPTTGVTPPATATPRFAVAPNPLRAGSTLSIALALARAQTVELTLIDIAGRRVAGTEARLDAGRSHVVWTPDGLRAGVYRVVARAGGARLGSASVVVLR